MNQNEPFTVRWQRRAVTIPTMLAVTAVATLGFPLLVIVAVAFDVFRLRFRLPTLRMYLFLLQYVINDTIEILLAPVLWLAAGLRIHSPASIARHQRLQWWSLQLLTKRARQLLGLRIELTEGSAEALFPGPVIVLSRHVSLLDASLPAIIYQSRGFHVRGVILAELLNDPGFDLLYNRSGSIFIHRDNGPTARTAVELMAQGLTSQTAAVIFPEGRLFREDVREQALCRLAQTQPDRADRLGGLKRVLPPRPGGVLALLASAPSADIVLLDHRGLDNLATLADLAHAVPVAEPIEVSATRFSRSTIPTDPAGQTAWLDQLWIGLDARCPVPTGR